ncbi:MULTISPECIES: BolA family protein [unclassified Achromobacter]|uniref:BolA family protein n=1 Tax=unclassified Achromobacter TaxID=2626865 RepID=UPI00069D93FA|nr:MULTISPECIES: BolA family protein [unclassified Achromobacter]KOF52485.1 BolA family transcriptional regulator [Achromobacter sp. DMS1]
MPDPDRIALIRERLAVLEPLSLEILDDSHLHAGHEGSKNGAGHYRVRIVAACFAGLAPVARHRLVYHHLQDLIPYPIHALALDAQAPQ